PRPALVVPDLFQDRGREVAERFELVVHREAHRDGGFQGAGGRAGEHKVEGADLSADLPRQRNPFCGKVRALAAALTFLREGMPSDLDGAHTVNHNSGTTTSGRLTREEALNLDE